VLDHFDLGAVAHERGAAGNFNPLPDFGRDAARPVQVGAHKHNSGAGRGGPQFDRNIPPAPIAKARYRARAGKRSLIS
jgi:hypothetical protein